MPLLKQKLKRLENHRQRDDFFPAMKPFLIMTIVTLFLAGCGQSEHEHSHGDGDGEHHQTDADVEPKKESAKKEEVKLAEPVAEAAVQPPSGVKPAEPVVKPAPTVEVVKAPNQDTDRALRDAIANGDIEAVEQQLAAGAEVNVKAARGWTPLHNAVDSDDKEIVELLINNGADVNATHNGGGTPLHWAARKGHQEIVELLITNGANMNAQDEDGGTPLFYASSPKISDLLRKHGGGMRDNNLPD